MVTERHGHWVGIRVSVVVSERSVVVSERSARARAQALCWRRCFRFVAELFAQTLD